jgi:hypothetical protein
VDSPLVASPTCTTSRTRWTATGFHVWVQGAVHFDWERLLADFRGFTQAQMH